MAALKSGTRALFRSPVCTLVLSVSVLSLIVSRGAAAVDSKSSLRSQRNAEYVDLEGRYLGNNDADSEHNDASFSEAKYLQNQDYLSQKDVICIDSKYRYSNLTFKFQNKNTGEDSDWLPEHGLAYHDVLCYNLTTIFSKNLADGHKIVTEVKTIGGDDKSEIDCIASVRYKQDGGKQNYTVEIGHFFLRCIHSAVTKFHARSYEKLDTYLVKNESENTPPVDVASRINAFIPSSHKVPYFRKDTICIESQYGYSKINVQFQNKQTGQQSKWFRSLSHGQHRCYKMESVFGNRLADGHEILTYIRVEGSTYEIPCDPTIAFKKGGGSREYDVTKGHFRLYCRDPTVMPPETNSAVPDNYNDTGIEYNLTNITDEYDNGIAQSRQPWGPRIINPNDRYYKRDTICVKNELPLSNFKVRFQNKNTNEYSGWLPSNGVNNKENFCTKLDHSVFHSLSEQDEIVTEMKIFDGDDGDENIKLFCEPVIYFFPNGGKQNYSTSRNPDCLYCLETGVQKSIGNETDILPCY